MHTDSAAIGNVAQSRDVSHQDDRSCVQEQLYFKSPEQEAWENKKANQSLLTDSATLNEFALNHTNPTFSNEHVGSFNRYG